ncbi:MAG: sensor histidine kinase [Candidatus Ornithospirochaeta sp.]
MIIAVVLALLFFVISVILAMRMTFISRDLSKMTEDIGEIISSESNSLIVTESGGKAVRNLASGLNRELVKMRSIRDEYLSGSVALKETAENMAHDLRTPLTAMKGYIDLLEEEDMGENAQKYLEIIKGRVEYMKEVTDELYLSLSMRRTDDLVIGEYDVRAILEEALISMMAGIEKKGIAPKVEIPEEKIVAEVDSKALFRVFANIVENAMKYSAGDLTVEMTGEKVVFSNYAPGMDGVDAARLLSRYYTVEGGRASSGLGLNIAKSLMKEMRGDVEVGLDGKTLRVSVLLPI